MGKEIGGKDLADYILSVSFSSSKMAVIYKQQKWANFDQM